MTAILGMAELLAEGELNAEQRRYIEILGNNGHALLDLINSILDLAKVESGRLTLERVGFDLREVVEKSAQTLAIRAHAKGLELTVSIAPGVPTALLGDPLRLRQVLINLIGNAIKFTEHGEVLVAVDRDYAPDEPIRLKFGVRDTGIGIAKDKVPALFAAFSQADSSTARKYGGSGLGLAIVKRLVNLMQGEVSLESEPRMGSVFSFTSLFELDPDAPAAAPWPDLAKVPMLIVDNKPSGRAVLRQMLTEHGAQVVEAASYEAGRNAIARAVAAGRPPRIVLLDDRIAAADAGWDRATDRGGIAVWGVDHRDDPLRQPGRRHCAAQIVEARGLPDQADRYARTCQSDSRCDGGRNRSSATETTRPRTIHSRRQWSSERSKFCSPTIQPTTGH